MISKSTSKNRFTPVVRSSTHILAIVVSLCLAGCTKRESSPPQDPPLPSPELTKDNSSINSAASSHYEAQSSPTGTLSAEQIPTPRSPRAPEGSSSPAGSVEAADAIKSTPIDIEAVHQAIIEALETGENDLAFRLARQAKRLAPEDSQTVYLTARVLAERNRFHEAILMLDNLAESTPEARLPILGQTAEWLVEAGRWDDAETRFLTLLKEIDDGPIVHRKLAQLYLRQGRRIEAANHLLKLCELGNVEEVELRAMLNLLHPLAMNAPQPEASETYEAPIARLGHARQEISNGKWNAARKTLESSPTTTSQEQGLLGRIYAHQKDYTALTRWYNSLNHEHTSDFTADAWHAIGMLQVHESKHRDAIESFCRAVETNPTDAISYRKLSEVLRQLGLDDDADRLARRSKRVQQTQQIGQSMNTGTLPSDRELSEIVTHLEKLRRPLEAFAWNAIRTVYAQSRGEIGDEDAIQQLNEINERRVEALRSKTIIASAEFRRCGLQPSKLAPP